MMGCGGKWKGGLGWGDTCTPMADVNVWQKPLQYCKVISLQLKEINFLKVKKYFQRKLHILLLVQFSEISSSCPDLLNSAEW